MQPSDETRSRDPWQSPAQPADEDRVVLDNQAVGGTADLPQQERGYPRHGAAYIPGDQEYLPADQAYPPGDQDYLPPGQTVRAPGEAVGTPGEAVGAPGEAVPGRGQDVWESAQPRTPARPPAATDDAPETPRPAATDERWGEILAIFVDDPRRSVKLAADVTDQAVDDLVSSVRRRQSSLASAWQDSDADTEALRSALRNYRDLWTSLRRDTPAAPGGDPRAAAAEAG